MCQQTHLDLQHQQEHFMMLAQTQAKLCQCDIILSLTCKETASVYALCQLAKVGRPQTAYVYMYCLAAALATHPGPETHLRERLATSCPAPASRMPPAHPDAPVPALFTFARRGYSNTKCRGEQPLYLGVDFRYLSETNAQLANGQTTHSFTESRSRQPVLMPHHSPQSMHSKT